MADIYRNYTLSPTTDVKWQILYKTSHPVTNVSKL